MFNRSKKISSRKPTILGRQRSTRKRLRVEPLETRDMLSGVVNINISAGNALTLTGDTSDNSVMLQYGGTTGSYTITGENGTLLQFNGAGQTFSTPQTVNGIVGAVGVNLGAGGTKTFDFAGPTTGATIAVPGINILNSAGVNQNIFTDVLIGSGGLHIMKGGAVVGESDLTITDSSIVGPTIVNNIGAGGDSTTMINTSTMTTNLEGGLEIGNGNGNNVTQIQGGASSANGTTIGAGLFNPGMPLVPAVIIINGTGGNSTTFASNTMIDGNTTITNGAHLAGFTDKVTFNTASTLGGVAVNDADGTTQVTVTNSLIGTQTVFGGPLVIQSNTTNAAAAGAAGVTVTTSSIPWGLFIDANNAATLGSTITVTSSQIATRPGGPPTTAAQGLPAFAQAGDGLAIVAETGNNTITVNGTAAAQNTIGGQLDLDPLGTTLNGVNNNVLVSFTTMVGLLVVTAPAGGGNSLVTLSSDNIQSSLVVTFASGANELVLNGTTANPLLVPTELTGFIVVLGVNGLDTLDNATSPAISVQNVIGFVFGSSIVITP